MQKKYIPDIQLIIVGDGAQRNTIEEFILAHDLHDTITITGFLDQEAVADITRSADLFLFTSSMDTFPTAVIEAITAGKPIVAVKNPALCETVHNGKNGIITSSNPQKIANAIKTILVDEKLRMQFSNYSKQLSQQFSITACADKLEALYTKVIEEKKIENKQKIEQSAYQFKLHDFNVPKAIAYLTTCFILLLGTAIIYSSAVTPASAKETPKRGKISVMVQRIKTEVKNTLSDYIATYSAY